MICKKCGEVDPTKFYPKSKSKCKKCTSTDNAQRYRDMVGDDKAQYKDRVRKWQTDNIFQFRWLSAKSRADKTGMVFDITVQQLKDLWEQQGGKCFYSGIDMLTEVESGSGPGTYSLSIDRKDSTVGYVLDNVVLCCSIVNIMKNNLNHDEFLHIVCEIEKFSGPITVINISDY